MSWSALKAVIDLDRHPIGDHDYSDQCRSKFDQGGVLVLEGFVSAGSIEELVAEAAALMPLAYFSNQTHTVYLETPNDGFGHNDARSRAVISTKGAVTADQLPADSALKALYDAPTFRSFLCHVLREDSLHEYADPLSSINVNFFKQGQELGWHFDNSEFAVTLLLQRPTGGGVFEFIANMRDASVDQNSEVEVAAVLDGRGPPSGQRVEVINAEPGSLVLFRGRDALHRVTPVEGRRGRVLVVLAYNTEPGLSLSEPARRTFFGRLG